MKTIVTTAGLLLLAGFAAHATTASAATCATTVQANDAMQYNTRVISVPASCKQFAVTLKHTGQLPVTVMGHNLVVTKTADMAGVGADGMKAGAAANYVKAGDTRVIAASKLVGGGQSTVVNIPVAKLKAGESYSFFCSFPGHSSMMRGTLSLTK
ncbi:azurin [Cognatilysobacter lacus]|uniref:Azurin n=1 Tax=Cognatilysobacter lacus TaxID=1643323 RepID=A0A5D8ZCU5_9GAMM|nr:azurin [Lysobacter lacus]TZF90484.1 azurin [Lysobacter lacus]